MNFKFTVLRQGTKQQASILELQLLFSVHKHFHKRKKHLYIPDITYLGPNILKTKPHNETSLAHAPCQQYFVLWKYRGRCYRSTALSLFSEEYIPTGGKMCKTKRSSVIKIQIK